MAPAVLTVAEARSVPVAASTTLTTWVPVFPATTHRPREETWRSAVPTVSLLPTQPEKSRRRLVGVKEVTKGAVPPATVVVVPTVVDVVEVVELVDEVVVGGVVEVVVVDAVVVVVLTGAVPAVNMRLAGP